MKEFEGVVEKDFTVVVFNDVKFVDNKQREYVFKLLSDGTNSAKTPPMFVEALGSDEIPNDAKSLLDAIRKTLTPQK
jgi:hypothetical protein